MKARILVLVVALLMGWAMVPVSAQEDGCGPALFELIDGLAGAAQDAFRQQGDAATAIALLEDIQELARPCAWETESGIEITDAGVLDVDIFYADDFYTEVFEYTRYAQNIRHYVLVMPESEAENIHPGAVFSSLTFPTTPGELVAWEGREEYAWAYDYLHEAPGGRFVGHFAPGRYQVAVAFIAAALSREDAGVGDDVILYPGITGGGASTDFWDLEIEPGETNTITIAMTDADGWACPWLYVFNGQDFDRVTEILRNVRGAENAVTETTRIDGVPVIDGTITLRIDEEKDEISFIDEFYVVVEGVVISAEGSAEGEFDAVAQVASADQDYLVMTRGDSVEFSFNLPENLADRDRVSVSVVVSGYYEALD